MFDDIIEKKEIIKIRKFPMEINETDKEKRARMVDEIIKRAKRYDW